jgi:ParB/RepB/Spo0J family partition protein
MSSEPTEITAPLTLTPIEPPQPAPPPDILRDVTLQLIDEDPQNVRSAKSKIEELAASILAQGLIQPVILLAQKNGRFRILAGHRRVAAVRYLGWSYIRGIVRGTSELSEADTRAQQLIENTQREDLPAIDVAQGALVIVDEEGGDIVKAAKRLGRSPAWVRKLTKMMMADKRVLALIKQHALSVEQANAVLVAYRNPTGGLAAATALAKELSDGATSTRAALREIARTRSDETVREVFSVQSDTHRFDLTVTTSVPLGDQEKSDIALFMSRFGTVQTRSESR